MDIDQIQNELDLLASAYAQKTGKQMASPPSLRVDGYYTGVSFYSREIEGKFEVEIKAPTFNELFDAAAANIDGMPSEEEVNMAEFTKNLAALIDEGHENNIDMAYVKPLSALAKKLSENMLTYQAKP